MSIVTPLNLYQRRIKAKEAFYRHELTKTRSDGLKFSYMAMEQIKPLVEKAYNDNGIVIDIVSMHLENVVEPWMQKNNYGGETQWHHQKGRLTLNLVNSDDPKDKAEVRVWGEAKDNSDKVINKVYTTAMKNFYKIEFNISEGPKDDTDAEQEPITKDVNVKKTQTQSAANKTAVSSGTSSPTPKPQTATTAKAETSIEKELSKVEVPKEDKENTEWDIEVPSDLATVRNLIMKMKEANPKIKALVDARVKELGKNYLGELPEDDVRATFILARRGF